MQNKAEVTQEKKNLSQVEVRSFEGDVCVRQVYLLMNTNIALGHVVPLATNTPLRTKKRNNHGYSF